MFQRLGRLMVIFYLNDEAQAIAGLMQARGWDEDRAAREVLGIGYEDLGVGVGKAWHFPDTILASMRPLPARPGRRPQSEEERLHVLAGLANSLADAVRTAPARERTARLVSIVERFGAATGVTEKTLAAAVEAATARFVKESQVMGFSQGKSPFLENARHWDTAARAPDPAVPPGDELDATTLIERTQLLGEAPAQPAAPQPAQVTDNRQSLLAAGVQDISNTLVGDCALNDVLRIVLETIYRGIGFTRVLLFLLDPGSNVLRCRFGFGADADALVRRGVSVPLAGARDVFSAALVQGADVCIEDVESEKVKAYVPDWYRKAIRARGMVLLPIVSSKRTVGLIYGDADSPEILRFRPEELNLLKTLRNQALLAMRQRG
jgi:GAF domain-containing protein